MMGNQDAGAPPEEAPIGSVPTVADGTAAAAATGATGGAAAPQGEPDIEAGAGGSVKEESLEPFLHADNARIVPQALDPSAFADNVEMEVLERLSRSQVRQSTQALDTDIYTIKDMYSEYARCTKCSALKLTPIVVSVPLFCVCTCIYFPPRAHHVQPLLAFCSDIRVVRAPSRRLHIRCMTA